MSSPRGGAGIFISYRREDAAAYALLLRDHLRECFGKDRVFMDIGSIAVGVDFSREIIRAVSGCDILLALIGRNWLAITDDKGRRRIDNPGDFVRIEIGTAFQRHIRVVPVLVNGAVLPQESDLPPSLLPLCKRQAVQLSHTGFDSEMPHLIEALRGSVTGQKRTWNLELVADEGVKKTFRLSSGREAHDISVRTGTRITITVDRRVVVNRTGTLTKKGYPLRALSSKLGSDVYIRVNYNGWTGRFTGIVLTIGDEVFTHSALWRLRP